MYRAMVFLSAIGVAVVFLQVLTAQSPSIPPTAESKATSENVVSETTSQPETSDNIKTAVLAGGCFWCTETDFEKCPGVLDVVSGYSGGTSENPTYKTYHDGRHTECAMITYDSTKVTFGGLVEWLIKHIDPTDGNGQFYDRGEGYKPIVFYANDEEKKAAEFVISTVNSMKVFNVPLAIELRERSEFWPAEDYHQDYHKNSAAHYRQYRNASGRDRLVKGVWGKRANVLEIEGSLPKGAIGKTAIGK